MVRSQWDRKLRQLRLFLKILRAHSTLQVLVVCWGWRTTEELLPTVRNKKLWLAFGTVFIYARRTSDLNNTFSFCYGRTLRLQLYAAANASREYSFRLLADCWCPESSWNNLTKLFCLASLRPAFQTRFKHIWTLFKLFKILGGDSWSKGWLPLRSMWYFTEVASTAGRLFQARIYYCRQWLGVEHG